VKLRKPFADRLTEHINRYVALRRALGYAFDTQAAALRAFGHFVQRRRDRGPLTQRLVLTFVLGCDVTPNVRQRRYAVLKNFADHFAVFDPRTAPLDPASHTSATICLVRLVCCAERRDAWLLKDPGRTWLKCGVV
jgi:hypothetical protein